MKYLVSIIIPCYNMSQKIGHLFDSVLAQTYKNLQIIVVNDGSTDNSEEVILSYKERFKEQEMQIDYIKQKNQGLGAAIDLGLKYIKGDFFCWPDADDWLTPDSVEVRMNFLLNNQEYGFVRSDAYVFYETDLKHPVGYVSNKHPDRFKSDNLLLDYIWESNVIYCPGCHFVRTSSFRNVCKNMEIYKARGGQNFQLLAPMLCCYKFGYIDEPLYNYVIYKKSMSHGDENLDDYILRTKIGEDIKIETLKALPLSGDIKQDYINQTRQKFNIARAHASYDFGELKAFEHYYSLIDCQYMPHSLLKIHKSSFLTSIIWLKLHKLIFKLSQFLKNSNIAYKIRSQLFEYKYLSKRNEYNE